MIFCNGLFCFVTYTCWDLQHPSSIQPAVEWDVERLCDAAIGRTEWLVWTIRGTFCNWTFSFRNIYIIKYIPMLRAFFVSPFMFPRQLAVVVVTLALTLSTPSSAHVQHRDHVAINRFIKRRSPSPQGGAPLIPVIGAAAPPPSSLPTLSTATTAPTSTPSNTTTEVTSSTPSGILPVRRCVHLTLSFS